MDDTVCSGGPAKRAPLSALDGLMALYNHPLVHFFENRRASPDFMSTSALKASLHRALREFPILLGRICDVSGGAAAVVIDDSNPNTPDFAESVSAVHYRDIKRAGFGWGAWPYNVATAGPVAVPTNGVVRLLSVHVVRLAENSGVILFCNIPHYIVDGIGYYDFLCRWAELFRTGGDTEPAGCTFDRKILCRASHEPRRPLDPMLCDMLFSRSAAVKLLARVPFAMRTRLVALGASTTYGCGHFFHVSSAAVEALRRAAPCATEPTSYSLLAALFGTAIFRAQEACGLAGGRMQRAAAAMTRFAVSASCKPRLLVSIIHTHHLRPPAAGRYIGNSFYPHPMCLAEPATGATAAGEFATAARQIWQAHKDVDADLVDEFYAAVEAHPLAGTSFALHAAAQPGTLTVIDERHYNTGGVDFGDGGPTWVSGLARHLPNFVALMADPEQEGGARVYASLGAATVDALLGDEFFTKHAVLMH